MNDRYQISHVIGHRFLRITKKALPQCKDKDAICGGTLICEYKVKYRDKNDLVVPGFDSWRKETEIRTRNSKLIDQYWQYILKEDFEKSVNDPLNHTMKPKNEDEGQPCFMVPSNSPLKSHDPGHVPNPTESAIFFALRPIIMTLRNIQRNELLHI